MNAEEKRERLTRRNFFKTAAASAGAAALAGAESREAAAAQQLMRGMKALFYNGTSFHKFSAAPDKRLYVNCVFSPAVSRHGRYYIMGFCGCISASGRTRTFQDQFGAFVFSSRNPVCLVKQGKLEGLWRAGRGTPRSL